MMDPAVYNSWIGRLLTSRTLCKGDNSQTEGTLIRGALLTDELYGDRLRTQYIVTIELCNV